MEDIFRSTALDRGRNVREIFRHVRVFVCEAYKASMENGKTPQLINQLYGFQSRDCVREGARVK